MGEPDGFCFISFIGGSREEHDSCKYLWIVCIVDYFCVGWMVILFAALGISHAVLSEETDVEKNARILSKEIEPSSKKNKNSGY